MAAPAYWSEKNFRAGSNVWRNRTCSNTKIFISQWKTLLNNTNNINNDCKTHGIKTNLYLQSKRSILRKERDVLNWKNIHSSSFFKIARMNII